MANNDSLAARARRRSLMKEIATLRDSVVVCYLTSIRPNGGAQMSEDAVRAFFEHLLLLQQRPIPKLDIFLCSNGGNGVVPWRLISLFREFADRIGVLIPFRAYSAATMLALGADEIVMHPFAEMGPIDPTVSNEFNPTDANTGQKLGISVEDVKSYISFIKDTVGIRHEDELIRAVEILANKVHPLALGNVERFISQNRMIARKILNTHMSEDSAQHKIDEVIETLASKLYFHGHPINRKEAKDELGLKVTANPNSALETAMWKLYVEYEELLQNNKIYDPVAELWRTTPNPVFNDEPEEETDPSTTQQVTLPALPVPTVPIGHAVTLDDTLALIESERLTSTFDVSRRFVVVGQGGQFEPMIRAEVLSQGWDHQSAVA